MKHFLPFSMLLAGAAFSGSVFAQEDRPQLTPSMEHPNIILFLHLLRAMASRTSL